jgi:hypothetical protein
MGMSSQPKRVDFSEWTANDCQRMGEWLCDIAADLGIDEGDDHDDMTGITDHVAKVRGLASFLKQQSTDRL